MISDFKELADDLRERYKKIKCVLHIRSNETEQWHHDRARLNSIAFRSDLKELDEIIEMKRAFDEECQVSYYGIGNLRI